MTDFDRILANRDYQRRMRLERKRREFWEDVEFWVTEIFIGLLFIGLLGVFVWLMVSS